MLAWCEGWFDTDVVCEGCGLVLSVAWEGVALEGCGFGMDCGAGGMRIWRGLVRDVAWHGL